VRYVGDYELLHEIARGGMGVVYRARQVSLNRIVAVKMILAGRFASESDVQRFRAEAAAAANLDHPNIVAIHEVGEHEGQHYFSMDFVEGQTLADRTRGNPLAPQLAAGYLKTIAEAVHYAHQRGILHRDLKPSNVLIDSLDRPRITDFGLAKRLTDSSLPTQQSSLTLSGQVLGSPNYMPPEQSEGRGRQATVTSDIYSLGAILYHLLTGRPPFMAETLAETLQQVLHTEPIPPRLLNPAVPRDLETICLKCLEKDPRRRYETANALARDLGRYMNNEAVAARPPSRLYRLQKLVRRNKLAFAAGAAVGLALVMGLAMATWGLLRERGARLRAQTAEKTAKTESAKSQQVAEFLKKMLQSVGPSVALGRDTSLLKYVLDVTAQQIDTELRDQPAVEADLLHTLGSTYHSLHESQKAEDMHRRALALRKQLFGNEHRDVATSLAAIGLSLYQQGKYAQAEEMHLQALAMRRKILGDSHPHVAESLSDLALTLLQQGKYAQAEVLLREALGLRKSQHTNDPRALDSVYNNLAAALIFQHKLGEAETLLHEAIISEKRFYGEDCPEAAASLNNLARVLGDQGRYPDAEAAHREAIAMARKLMGGESPQLATFLSNFAATLSADGKFAEAEACCQDALAIQRKRLSPDHPAVADTLNELGATLGRQNKYAEAEQAHREALAIRKKKLDEAHPLVVVSLGNLANSLYRQSKYAEAEPLCREILQRHGTSLHPDQDPAANLARLLSDWAWAEHGSNSGTPTQSGTKPGPAEWAREAESLLRDCLAIRLRDTNSTGWRAQDARSRLGGALVSVAVCEPALTPDLVQSKLTEAESLLLEASGRLQPSNKAPRWAKSDALERLVRLYEAWDSAAPNTAKSAQAEEWKKNLVAFRAEGEEILARQRSQSGEQPATNEPKK
jgi:tetratricopeptide (TPR) repeat protein